MSTRITAVHAEPLDLELNEPFAIATGTQGAITNVLITLELQSGARGLGEASSMVSVDGFSQREVLAAIDGARDELRGADVRAWRDWSPGLHALPPSARAGLEMAALDALGRHDRVPLWRYWGGRGDVLETDMTITAGDLAHAVDSARAILRRGISTLKIKVGARGPEEDAARVRAIRDAAPQARLLADANGGWSESQAESFLDALVDADVPLSLFEQPIARAPDAAAALGRLAQRVLVCADESARNAAETETLADAGVPAINLKTMKSSVLETHAMWQVAQARGLRLMIGGMVESRLSMAFSAHLAAGLGGFDFVDLDTPMFVRDDPFEGGYAQQGAVMRLDANAPGHGVRWATRSP